MFERLFLKCSNAYLYSVRTLIYKVFERLLLKCLNINFKVFHEKFKVFELKAQSVQNIFKNVRTWRSNVVYIDLEPSVRTLGSNIFFLYVRTWKKTHTDEDWFNRAVSPQTIQY